MPEKRIVLLGPPGAGKGTQAQLLCETLELAHLATGGLLRSAVANATPVGLAVKPHMESGRLVPDEIVIDVLMEAVDTLKKATPAGPTGHGHSTDNGYVLDGFPRTFRQAEALERVLKKRREKIDAVILIDTPDEVIQERLMQRRSCPDPLCGAVYNVKTKPPKVEGLCDVCEKALIIRDDDRPETIRFRQQQYWHDTAPLVDFYQRRGLLVEVPGTGALEEVSRLVLEAARTFKKKRVS